MASSFQDQIDQINGNQADAEDRQFQKTLEDIRQKAEEGGVLDSQAYRDAVARATSLHELKLKQIKEQAEEQRQRDEEAAQRKLANQDTTTGNKNTEPAQPTRPAPAPTPAPAPSGKQTIEIVLNGSVLGALKSATPAEIDSVMIRVLMPSFMREIRRAAAATGLGGSLR
jgi:hypothetical protein